MVFSFSQCQASKTDPDHKHWLDEPNGFWWIICYLPKKTVWIDDLSSFTLSLEATYSYPPWWSSSWSKVLSENENAVHTHILISDHISFHKELMKLCFNVTPATVEWISTENFCRSGWSNRGCWWMQQFYSLQQMEKQSWQLHSMPLHVHWEKRQLVAWSSSF